MDFEKALTIGRRYWLLSKLFKADTMLLSLSEITNAVPPESSSYKGMKDIEVDKVIGSEQRSKDFAKGFYPIHKWMGARWEKVKKLLMSDKIRDSIDVVEYGGYYFVKDGNHRISVAKTNNIKYITADITSMRVPVSLYPNMTREKLHLFKEKYKFYKETRVFDYIPEEMFLVERPETWRKLKSRIFVHHKRWYKKKNGYEPDDATLILDWNIEIYETTMEKIKKMHIKHLTPKERETDVFCDLMEYWEYGMPGEWFNDVYDRFVKELRKHHILRSLLNRLIVNMKSILINTAEEERTLFMQASRLDFFRPYAEIPGGSAKWYRFLHHQLMVSHRKYLAKKLGRNPYMYELTINWYDKLFEPAYKLYEALNIKSGFPKFYMEWMKSWEKIVLHQGEATLEESFSIFVKNKQWIISNKGKKDFSNNDTVKP